MKHHGRADKFQPKNIS